LSTEGKDTAYQAGQCLANISRNVSELVIFELQKPRTPGGVAHIRETWHLAELGYEDATAGERSLGEEAKWIHAVWGLRSLEFMQWFREISDGSGEHPAQGDAVVFAMGIGPNLDMPFEVATDAELERWRTNHGLSPHARRSDVVTEAGAILQPGFNNFKDWHKFLNAGNAYLFQCSAKTGTWSIGTLHIKPCRSSFALQDHELQGDMPLQTRLQELQIQDVQES